MHNTIENSMNSNCTKGKEQKPKDVHITIVTNPTKLVQPYLYETIYKG